MKQFRNIEIDISKALLSSDKDKVTVEIAEGVEITLRLVDKLPDRYHGVKVSMDDTVVLTPTDIAEGEKTGWLNNRYAGQEMAVRFLSPRSDDKKKTKSKGK